ncbi:hypothetical protein FUA48_11150 [Flavobacterium alkalisoli]|uniref:Uncharacterized protein n=1 Tax=Flavobacterium alkalisoli TaxID=2602769 RepID=A0A5B9FVM9_9FLAO|nr:hypothetical protein [Flavobacterium alkalisoli]QEE50116.1 hypothetical protein FUA48_11150 [Flavobacterium alkalisoli]
MDIVRLLQLMAEDHNLIYHYGKKAALNLLEGSVNAGETYLLHEFTNRKSEYNNSGTRIMAHQYTGKFFLVKQSDFDQQYFAERDTAQAGKYATNIEPLLTVFETLGNRLSAKDYTVSQWENIDVTDALDANMDGLLCSYSVTIPVKYDINQ